jgi:hypothetical protein
MPHACGCAICKEALTLVRSLIEPSGEDTETFLQRTDGWARRILRDAERPVTCRRREE